MSGFGPPPGPPEQAPRARASYLAPGRSAMDASARRRYAVSVSARPGIVPLSPIGAGDIIDGAIKHVRRNPGPVLGAGAIAVAAAVIPAILVSSLVFAGTWRRSTGVSTVVNDVALSAGVAGLGIGLSLLALGGILGPAVLDAVLGHRVTSDELWSRVRRRVVPLVAGQVLVGLIVVAPIALVLAVVVAMAQNTGVAAAFAAILLFPVGGVLSCWASGRMLFTAPAQVLEGVSIVGGLRRAWALTRGRFWRVFATQVSIGLLAFIVFWFVEITLYFVGRLLLAMLELDPRSAESATSLLFTLAMLGAGALVAPVVASSSVLLYIDARIRAEGFDLDLRRQAAGATP